MTIDEKFMHRCLQLAELGAGNVAPNPMVGAVLVHDNKIIGEGYHKKYGEAHAEVNCINSVSKQHIELIKNATLYVSLEPCAHYGKTPPCADLIIKNNIPKVIIGSRDIYKDVNGKGIEKLQQADINVITGILESDCLRLNKRFFSFHQKKRPYIILKWAQSLNGKISNSHNFSQNSRVLISNEYTTRIVHKWRSEETGIMVGTNTALIDDPLLTARFWKGKNPVRIIIDRNLRLPSYLKIFSKDLKTIIFNTINHEEKGNTFFYKLLSPDILIEITEALYKMNIQSVLVEGGTKLLQSFIDAGLWDEARIICNRKMIIGDGLNAPELHQFELQKEETYFSDTITYFKSVF
ncbi:MAG: bifunctional diaminohydroxyphosphoribosylaminopyrimidine deaminase/5-amino-6-(5-phosphoribosylamino)uracil reductase RibD [Ginsengibacter sp.]